MKTITTLFFYLIIVVNTCFSFGQTTNIKSVNNTEQKKIFKYRKYNHVKNLYARLASPVTELCIKHRVPPAAVLSIISLESGWGQGYIGNITGNFLSLNAVGNNAELPALKMPQNRKTKEILIDPKKIAKLSTDQIVWVQRPASLKKDYRPKGIAGTKDNLDFFLKNPTQLTQANLANVTDFVTRFISYTSRIKAYNQARKLLDDEIEKHGINILFNKELNERFVKTIGGRPNSFNFRETWPKKVLNILKNVGANELAKDIYFNKIPFEQAW